MAFKKLIFATLMASFFFQCASTSTKMVDSWSASNLQPEKWQKVLIVAIAKTQEGKSAFENKLKEKLEKKKISAVAATSVLPPDEKISKETFYNYFQNEGFDAVIVSRLASVQDLPGFTKPGNDADFFTFYDQKYDEISVDYSNRNVIIGVETTIYETGDLSPIWSGLSKSFEPRKPKKLINDLTQAIFDAIKEEGFF